MLLKIEKINNKNYLLYYNEYQNETVYYNIINNIRM